MKVKINIHTAADCGEQNFRTCGELEFSEFGFSVSYRLDGDDCILEFNGVRAVQRRSGRLTFIMEFAEGEETELHAPYSYPPVETADSRPLTKIEIVARKEKLESLKRALNDIGITGMTVFPVAGCGVQKGYN